jgi:ubiquinone/menaquinone biosynthesis C-methylase UbiE
MGESEYFHGFSPQERQRLVRQSEYWRHSLIPLDLSFQAGDRILEIGCAVGATLAVLASAFPGIRTAGIDLEPGQIDFARRYLASKGLSEVDLRAGDGRVLPWGAESFDGVYIMWLFEHLKEPISVLREAHRVLRPGGRIIVTETDYAAFKVLPSSPDWDYVERAQYEFFSRHGNPVAGRQLGPLLLAAGFGGVRNAPVGFHFFAGGGDGLRKHVEYVVEFLEPGLPKLASLGFDLGRLQRGLAHLRSIPTHPGGSMSQIVYRAHGTRGSPPTS